MIQQLRLFLKGESWRAVARQSIMAYLRARGESTKRDITIDTWTWRRKVWAVVGPSPQELATQPRPPVGGVVAGGLGQRHICVDLQSREVVEDLAFQ